MNKFMEIADEGVDNKSRDIYYNIFLSFPFTIAFSLNANAVGVIFNLPMRLKENSSIKSEIYDSFPVHIILLPLL